MPIINDDDIAWIHENYQYLRNGFKAIDQATGPVVVGVRLPLHPIQAMIEDEQIVYLSLGSSEEDNFVRQLADSYSPGTVIVIVVREKRMRCVSTKMRHVA